MTVESRSMYGGFSLLGRGVCILLLRLASFRTTSRPLSRWRRWRGLRFSGYGCTLGCICGTCRSGAIHSRVRTLIGVDLSNALAVSELLVQESRGR